MTRARNAVAITVAVLAVLLVSLAAPAQAAVSVSRAEVSGTTLRIEGRATTNRPITVDGVRMATSSSSGSFRIEWSGYTWPADCTVDVNDGSAAALNVQLSGCIKSKPKPTPTPTPTPTVQTPATALTPTPAPAASATATATPTPGVAAALTSVHLAPASLQGGGTSAGTVGLTAPAPVGGAVVSMSSSNPAVATVPATMTVPAGVSSYFTLVSTRAVTTTTNVVISARYNGVTRTTVITATPARQPTTALDSIFLDPATVPTGTARTSATLYFTELTPSGGAVVTLSSSNTSVAGLPPAITVPPNSSTGGFDVIIGSSAAGSAIISATYNGLTRSAVLTVSAQPVFRIITASPLPNARVGENYTGFIEACCGQGSPYTWSLASGTVPDGLRFVGNDLNLTRTTGVTGMATRVQTTTFTVQAQDEAGKTTTKTFTLTVDPASPLVINNGSGQLADGTVGVAYETGLFQLGGVPPWQWSFVTGTLPPGLVVQASPGRVKGTPTTAGTFTFTVRVADSVGNIATGEFTVVVAP